jgi:hypothetical protein
MSVQLTGWQNAGLDHCGTIATLDYSDDAADFEFPPEKAI